MSYSNRILILGAMIDQVDRKTALSNINRMIDKYSRDLTPCYVATVNSDFLANMLGWSFFHPKSLELLRILRESNLSTADGMPIVWLAKWLNCPLPERVTGQDLFPEIAAMLAKDKKRIFLLGGTGKVAWEAAAKLKKEYPNLVIAGVDEPHIHIKGEWLENTFEQDELLVENINSAKPDILFLQLGNPKQELLFDRIRSQLKVPVTIGIGGSFERYTGKIPRAPNWMQKTGMEWLQRLIMEPGRLWKRYVIDFLKLIYFGTPLLIFHHVNKLFAPENSYRPLHNSLFLAPEKTITIIPLPKCFDKNTVAEVETLVQEAFDFDVIIFDFRSVKHIDAAASALLIKVWMAAQKKEKEIFALKIPWNIRTLLRLNHAWGYLSDRACNSAREIVSRLKDRDPLPELFESIIQIPPFLFLSFFGELDNSQNYAELSEALQHLMINKVLVVDLTYCVSVESLGWSFLMTLTKGKDNLALIGLNSTLRRQLKQVELDPYFRIFDTKDEFLATQ